MKNHFVPGRNKHVGQAVWDVGSPAAKKVAGLAATLGISSLLSKVLVSRGFEQPALAQRFLTPQREDLCDAFLLTDMGKAVDRIAYALEHDQRICIFGDYDADGVTATALLMRFFRWHGHDVHYYIPHRLNEGYGLNLPAVKRLVREGYHLLITVDNGISSVEEVAYAQSHGMDVVITDHHQCADTLPAGFAVINPARPDCPYPFPLLSGVGVAFKLVQALMRRLEIDAKRAEEFLSEQLAFVALGTIADIVPLQDENRVLANFGLRSLQGCRNVGLATALRLAGARSKAVTSKTVAFALVPRLNAAGRMEHASLGVELLLTDDEAEATALARRLNRLNEDRRSIEQEIFSESLEMIEREMMVERQRILIVEGEGWHAGVTGIVATRIMEYFNRPVIVFSVEKEIAKGSARSIERYNIHDALTLCRDLLLSYGGHTRAAGLRIHRNNLEPFKQLINRHASERISDDDLLPRLKIDADVEPRELTVEAVASLDQMEPFGTANQKPLFRMCNVHVLERPRVVGNNHLKMDIFQGETAFSAIGFSMGHVAAGLHDEHCTLDIAFTPIISDYYGYDSVELELRDLRINR